MWKWWFAIKIGENQRKFRGISLEVLCLRSNDFLSGNTQMPKAIGTVRDAAEGRGDVYGARKGTWSRGYAQIRSNYGHI